MKIIWNDAKLFSPKNKDIGLSKMETVGLIEEENALGVIVRDPKTINLATKKQHPEKQPTFYFIPKGMIKLIEYLA